jgi:hypothetical protein
MWPQIDSHVTCQAYPQPRRSFAGFSSASQVMPEFSIDQLRAQPPLRSCISPSSQPLFSVLCPLCPLSSLSSVLSVLCPLCPLCPLPHAHLLSPTIASVGTVHVLTTDMASLFSCCTSDARSNSLEAESRHARIVAATGDYARRPRSPPQRRRQYQESPPQYKDIAQHPLISVDEKNPLHFELIVQGEDDTPPPVSPRSSVVSIPSTRMTDLTAAQTGETTRATLRGSLEYVSTRGSEPPSYYSNRSPSPASSAGGPRESERSERDTVWQHPVMTSDWLEVLMEDAARRAEMPANNEEQDRSNTRRVGFS